MTNSNETCTCPSGDGSLRHPCLSHQSNENELKVEDVVVELNNLSQLVDRCDRSAITEAIALIKQQQEQLEAARKEVERLKSVELGLLQDLANQSSDNLKMHKIIQEMYSTLGFGICTHTSRTVLDELKRIVDESESKPEDNQP